MQLLSLQDISYAYHNLNGETPALSHISFEVAQGEFLAIVGPSGCGNAMVKFWKLCLPLRFIFHPQKRSSRGEFLSPLSRVSKRNFTSNFSRNRT